MGDFDADTRVAGGEGRFRAALSPDWSIWGPNGGYLAAIALRAAGGSTSLPRPASFACHFLAPAEFAEVELVVTPLRVARRAASLRVSMLQGERAILEAIVWVADRVDGLAHTDATMPGVPAPDALRSIEEVAPPEVLAQRFAFWSNLEERPVEDWVPWPERRPGRPVFREWFRFRPRATFGDDAFLDAARALLLVDTMGWPAACHAHVGALSFVAPSLDVSVRFHDAAPEAEWLLCDARSPVAKTGLIGTEATVWSPDGRLLASGGSQLLCRPAAPPRSRE